VEANIVRLRQVNLWLKEFPFRFYCNGFNSHKIVSNINNNAQRRKAVRRIIVSTFNLDFLPR